MADQIITIDQEVFIVRIKTLQSINKKLLTQLAYERQLRLEAEAEVAELKSTLCKNATQKKGKTIRKEYSEFKSDGNKKATSAEPINSFDDFKIVSDWFWGNSQYRNWALWWCGISFGLRFSDLVSLKWKNVLNEDGSFRERIKVYEKKTGKFNSCLISESVVFALSQYIEHTKCECCPDDYVFPAHTKGKGDGTTPITTSQGCKILKAAADGCGVTFHLSTHTMRKSLINIAGCVGNAHVDMAKFIALQGLANHSNITTTMKYMNKLNELYDKFRVIVSDFLLGKTGVNELVWENDLTLDMIDKKLTEIQKSIKE